MNKNRNFFFYGIGSIAFGIKGNAFSWFLFFYYNMVIGLPAWMASLALGIATIWDAFSDLLVGYSSDHTKSRLGRRHPYMYAALIPVPIFFYYLWNPPTFETDINLFLYLLVMAILVRTSTTFFEIPNQSLGPEITREYHERTRMMSLRYFFGWMGGTVMTILMWFIFLKPTVDYPNGQLNPQGYETYGVVAASLMLIAMIVSSLGLNRIIPNLSKPAKNNNFSEIKDELKNTLLNPSFLVLFIGGIFAGMASGLSAALNIYFNTFFWGFNNIQIGIVTVIAVVPGIVGAMIISRILSVKIGKREAAIVCGMIALILTPVPYALKIYGLAPEFGSNALLLLMSVYYFIEVSTGVAVTILVSSMVSDIVEDSELTTKKRSEGIFFSAQGFSNKAVSGVGIFLAGLVTSLAGLSTDAKPGSVDDSILINVALIFVPIYMVLYLLSLYFLNRYKIDKETHEKNISEIDHRTE
ncbi:MFS transporter [Hyphomicrobiales bacterium]|nr:MFS transporter [Hyphomicrobiales bacterium]